MMIENTLEIRRQLAADIHRPRYHFLPPSNWMNDPNGVIQWEGQYHLFYQYNPNAALWGDIHWGHAVSDDLVHWGDLPLALYPTPGGPDDHGCFSGCAVDNGVPTVFYTAAAGAQYEIQTQCMATSDDGLLTWHKHPNNPIVSAVPPESGQTADFRDPFVWKEGDIWYMLLGSRITDVGGTAFLYRSHNLLDWEYLNPLLVGDMHRNGVIWECPNFFKLGDEWVLIVSAHTGLVTGDVFYFVGSYENHRFTPIHEGVLDYGHLYAPLSMVDDQNRRLLFGWLREARSEVDQRKAGWSGVQSIPRVLSLDEKHRLLMKPAPELETLRGQHHHVDQMDLTAETTLDVRGLALDIVAEFDPAGSCGIALACSADGHERIDIVYDAAQQRLIARKIQPDAGDALITHLREVPHHLDAGETLRLRILLDGSVVEVIANDRTSVTSRIYPSRNNHQGVRLFGTNALLHRLDIWEMPSIWQ